MPDDIVADGIVTADDTGLHFETLSFGTPGQASGACDGDFPE
ncbi:MULTISPECIES: hypothetical protein [Hyphomonas]|nr:MULTISPECIES: hypothetical protein [Hyphomonas]